MQLNALADQVVVLVKNALGPLVERIAGLEARLAVLGDLRDRVVVVETKAAMPGPEAPCVDLAPVLERLAFVEERPFATKAFWDGLTETVIDLRVRLAVLEARPLLPGPAGEPGPPGKDGIDGKDGSAGLSFEGVYQDGQTYEKGHLATWAGSSWHCNTTTTTKPGDGSKDWTLMVKRGRDGKDGHDFTPPGVPVVSVGRPQ